MADAQSIIREPELRSKYDSVKLKFQMYQKRFRIFYGFMVVGAVTGALAILVPALGNLGLGAVIALYFGAYLSLIMAARVGLTVEDKAFKATYEAADLIRHYSREDGHIARKVSSNITSATAGFPVASLSTSSLIRDSVDKPSKELRATIRSRLTEGTVRDPNNVPTLTVVLDLLATYFMKPSVDLMSRVSADIKALLPETNRGRSRTETFVAFLGKASFWTVPSSMSLLGAVVFFYLDINEFQAKGSDAFGVAALLGIAIFGILFGYLNYGRARPGK